MTPSLRASSTPGYQMTIPENARELLNDPRTITYQMGWCDGVIETVNQLLGNSVVASGGVYKGEIPAELETWLTAVLKRAESIKP